MGDSAAIVGDVTAALEPDAAPLVTIAEADANALLASQLAYPLQTATLWIEPDLIWLRLDVQQWGSHTLWLSADVVASDGSPAIAIASIRVDGRLLPRFVATSLTMATNDALADAQLSVHIEKLAQRQGVVILNIRPE